MIRIITLFLLVAAAPAAAQDHRPAPTLKPSVTVASEVVRIGDLVENAGTSADIAIFRAPNLGETGAVPIARVIEALRPHNVPGLNTRGFSEVIVSRAGRTISLKDIEARIAAAFARQHGFGEAANLTVAFDREARGLNVEPSADGALQVARASIEQRSGRFEIVFDLPGSAIARHSPLRYTGTVTETVEVAMPAQPVARGEILRAADLVIERRPKAQVGNEAPIAADQVPGLAARQSLRAGQVLRRADLMKPELVGRNDTVTILYEVPGVLLTLRGKALESGAEGDVINVQNMQSKRTLQGVVAGPGRVIVTGTTQRLAANASATTSAPRRQ